ncbi:hypothetical protein HZ326_14449 [Fusarium oxysporum f. sp. albedinis]|nr:hypothetical protein HZ326_14449 [Fusarium oxysporum f. sp. albedinis]
MFVLDITAKRGRVVNNVQVKYFMLQRIIDFFTILCCSHLFAWAFIYADNNTNQCHLSIAMLVLGYKMSYDGRYSGNIRYRGVTYSHSVPLRLSYLFILESVGLTFQQGSKYRTEYPKTLHVVAPDLQDQNQGTRDHQNFPTGPRHFTRTSSNGALYSAGYLGC